MLRIRKRALPHGKFFNLDIGNGEILFLQGPNGSGKSLLLKSIANLIPGKFDEFTFQEKNLSEWDYSAFRSQVMYTATLAHFPSEGTTEDFLKVPFSLAIHAGKKPALDTDLWLKRWNMSALPLSQLSSGQKQALGILRVLSLDARLLLLDEPISHLDAGKTSEVESLILDWMKCHHGSVIIVGHDPDQPNRLGGKVMKIEKAWV